MRTGRRFAAGAALAALAAPLAYATETATCSRVIQVPMAATGLSVIAGRETDVKSSGIKGGVYPDLLRRIQDKGHCRFAMRIVPRARLELMFSNGSADLLIPATRAPQRDVHGIFVPMLFNRATVISTRREPQRPVSTAQELLDDATLKVVLVRGFTYGPAYDELVRQLGAQGKVRYEADPLAVARTLDAGSEWVTIMAPSILAGAIRADGRHGDLLQALRFEPIAELPWGDSGAYISRSSLNEADRNTLKTLLENAVRSGLVWKGFQDYYGDDVLGASLKPR